MNNNNSSMDEEYWDRYARGLINPTIINNNDYHCFCMYPTPVIVKHFDSDFIQKVKDAILEDFSTACPESEEYFKDYHQQQWRNLQPVIDFCRGNDKVFQSRDDLYRLDCFKPVSESIIEAFHNYAAFCNLDIQGCTIHSMWYNIYRDKGENNRHMHPNSFASGVIVVQDNEAENEKDYASFHFYNPNSITQVILPKFYQNTPSIFFAQDSSFRFKPGTLIIFPSYLQHSAHNLFPKDLDYEDTDEHWRITLAFNIMIKGDAGDFGSYYYY